MEGVAAKPAVAEELVVAGGAVAALPVPFGKVAQLDLENGGLDGVEAGVPADLVVVVAAGHAVGAERAGAGGELRVGGGDEAGVAEGGEVLGGVEAEGGGVAERAGAAGRLARRSPRCAEGLGGVFDQKQPGVVALLRPRSRPSRRTGRRGGRAGWL